MNIKCLPSEQGKQRTQCLPSEEGKRWIQFTPSDTISTKSSMVTKFQATCVASMDHASTPTECMKMLSNIVDVEYQKEPEFLLFGRLSNILFTCVWPTLQL